MDRINPSNLYPLKSSGQAGWNEIPWELTSRDTQRSLKIERCGVYLVGQLSVISRQSSVRAEAAAESGGCTPLGLDPGGDRKANLRERQQSVDS